MSQSITFFKLGETYIFLLSFILILCCASQQVVTHVTEIDEKPKLLFLNYNIVKIDDTKKIISLINQKTIEGRLKGKTNPEFKGILGDLECSILDSGSNEIEKMSIKNPLVEIVEFINDLGNFEKRKIDLDSAQFSIRLQLPPKSKYIVIRELTQTGKKNHITTEIE